MASLATTANLIKTQYLPLIKSRQTLLLTLTGVAGYLCQPGTGIDWLHLAGLAGSLLATISGCTVLNMLFDRDIDAKMERTRHRPLAAGQINASSAALLGCGLVLLGLLWSALLSWAYLAVILMGAGMNVLVYTLWLKRRTAWSILWGGLAGGMPILAGRVLATGHADLAGVLLALIIVCWIPSHNLTLSMLHSADYRNAGVPTILNRYGFGVTHFIVTLSCLFVSIIFILVFNLLGFHGLLLGLLYVLSLGLVSLAVISWSSPTQKLLTILYKYSSLYLLISTLLLLVSGIK